MEHLVEGHLGGYYISNQDPEIITEYCDTCGDSDWILCSWEEGQMIPALVGFFSRIDMERKNIEAFKNEGDASKVDIIDIALSEFDKNNYILLSLEEDNYLNSNEVKLLKDVIKNTKNKQIDLIREVYSDNKVKKLNKKNNN